MDKTDKEVLELCKSWFEDIAERSDRLTTGNVSHSGRAIHGVAMHYAEYVNEHLHNRDKEHKVAWSEEDEKILHETSQCVYDNVANIGTVNKVRCIDWLKSLKERIQPHEDIKKLKGE